MPTTVNGVGTHYYGKSDSSSRPGTCRSCGTYQTLESYNTRLWFVILFIPIIPLKRVRLLDYCPRCSRHYVANPEEYEMSRQLAVSGAMEKYRALPTVEGALAVHAQMLSFHMHTDADSFREEALERHPQSGELREGLASHLDQMGRWNEATPLYEQAFELKSDLADTRASLAWRRSNEGDLDEAYDLLDFLRKPGAGHSYNLAALDSLAKAYQKANKHERALELFSVLLRENPDLGDQYEFRKHVTKSERALGESTSLLPEKSFSVRGLFDSKTGTHAPWVRWTVFGTIVAMLFMFGMAGLNEYQRMHRTLHVVNAFAQPVMISIDGQPPVTVGSRTPIPISEGKHKISVTGPVNSQSEIDLQSNYWTRWTYSPGWVFNVEKAALVVSNTLHYAIAPPPQTQEIFDATELAFVPHVDYLFEQPPQTLKVEGRNNVVTKMHLDVIALPPRSTFMRLRNLSDPGVALTFAEGHLERNPNDPSLLNLYLSTEDTKGNEQRVLKFLEAGLWRKPISIVWHRTYQNSKSVNANEAALAAEYDTRLKETPDDAAMLYLRGRVGPDRADQLKHFTLAHEKNPNLGWPSMALAYDAANRGEWQEAKEWCDKGVGALGSDPSFGALWHVVRIANGMSAAIEGEYRQRLNGNDYAEVTASLVYLVDVLATDGKCDQARQTVTNVMGPQTAFNPLVDYICGDEEAIRKRMQQPSQGDAISLFQGLLAIGEPDAALKLEGVDHIDDWSPLLATSVSYAMAGNATEADAWRAKACDALKQGDGDQQRAAALLQSEQPPTSADLDEIVLRINDTPLFIAALAQRFPDHKAELNKRAARLNVCRLPPYLIVKKAIAQP